MLPAVSVFAINSGGAPRPLDLRLSNISLDDVSRQLPQGLYSTFRTFGNSNKVIGLQAHLARLYLPSAKMGIQPSAQESQLRETLKGLLDIYRPGEARVRISLSLTEEPGQIFVMCEPFKLPDEQIYKQGIRVVTSHAKRTTPRLKSTIFIQNSGQERQALLKAGVFEALIVNNGFILEGLTSNFYAVLAGKIITARYNVLLGVTRRFVLRLARAGGVGVDYRSLRIDELPRITEAFITSSSRSVVPVVEVDSLPVGDGKPGMLAQRLRRDYDSYVLEKAEHI